MKPTNKGANTRKNILEKRNSMYFDSSEANQDKDTFAQFLDELEKDIKKYKRDQLHELYISKATEVEKKIKEVWNTVIFEKRGMIDATDTVLMKEVGIKIDSQEEKLKSNKN